MKTVLLLSTTETKKTEVKLIYQTKTNQHITVNINKNFLHTLLKVESEQIV